VQEEKLLKYYDEFNRYVEEIGKVHSIRRERYEQKWVRFINATAVSSLNLYSFGSVCAKEYIQPPKFSKDSLKENRRLLNFYNDLVMSKLKQAIFTENSRDSKEDMHGKSLKSLRFVALGLLYDGAKYSDKQIQVELYKLHYQMFLFYDFLNRNDKLEGKFLNFETENKKGVVENTVRLFQNLVDEFSQMKPKVISKEFSIPQAFSFFYKNLKNIQGYVVRFNRVNYVFVGINREPDFDDDYEAFFLEDTKTIEPLTRYYSMVLWKIGQIVKDSKKYILEQDMIDFIANKDGFIDHLTQYLTNLIGYFKIYSKYIDGNSKYSLDDIFISLYWNDKKFIYNEILTKLLSYNNKDISLKSILKEKVEQLPQKIEFKYKEDVEFTNFSKCLSKIASLMFDSKNQNTLRGPWKFENLIYNANIEELTVFLTYLQDLSKDSLTQYDGYLGAMTSGVFVAHLLNIATGNFHPIYLYRAFPYISFLPTTIELNKKLLLIDESMKSGYTAILANRYSQRKSNLKVNNVLSIGKYKNFDKENIFVNSQRDINFTALFEFDIEMLLKKQDYSFDVLNTLYIDSQVKVIKKDSIVDFIKSLYLPEKEIKDIVEKLIIFSKDSKNKLRVDNTRILSDTRVLFIIANHYLNSILEKSVGCNKVNLYALSDYGKIIQLAVIFLIKTKDDSIQKKFSYNTKNPSEDSISFAFDLSKFSEDTEDVFWKSQQMTSPKDLFYFFISIEEKLCIKNNISFFTIFNKEK
jgi:hypothetical protein